MNRINWEMRVAVISNIHMPPEFTGQDLLSFRDNAEIGSPIVYLDDLEDVDEATKEWLLPLKDHINRIRTNPKPYNWVRFDPDGDVIDGLRKFDWN